MKNRIIQYSLTTLLLLLMLAIVTALSLAIGSSGISASRSIQALIAQGDSIDKSIILNIRLPRILLGFAVGGSLSLAGLLLQGLFRNPLVEPYTIGISGGAALGIAIAISFNTVRYLGVFSLPVAGFIGAFLVMALLFTLAARNKLLRIQNVLLIGVMISFISSSLMLLIMAVSKSENLQRIIFWMMGSLDQNNWGLIQLSLFISILSLIISYFFAISLNALVLGEEQAAHLGIDIEKSKRSLFIIASVITGFCVSVAGVIGFIGLLVPHVMRMMVGRDHRILIIASFLGGSSFLIFSDTIARTIISPQELPVGVITGLLGGLLFIYTLTASKAKI